MIQISSLRRIAVLGTGGTIASRQDERGRSVARDGAGDLLARVRTPSDVAIVVEDLFRIGSYRMTIPLMAEVATQVREHLCDRGAAGVVVTHGTDTLEETAFFLDLFHDLDRPVVLTGAQRPADAPDSDGPRNLADAIVVAAHTEVSGLGALVVFDGSVFPARGLRKSQTVAATAFESPAKGILGSVMHGDVILTGCRSSRHCLQLSEFDAGHARVDIVACYPGADATALYAFANAGADGIVLEATGSGNANPDICDAVKDLTGRGIVVALSTRVAHGPIVSIYGDGGGSDLVAAGAVPAGLLRPSQARIALSALIGVYKDPVSVRERLPVVCSN